MTLRQVIETVASMSPTPYIWEDWKRNHSPQATHALDKWFRAWRSDPQHPFPAEREGQFQSSTFNILMRQVKADIWAHGGIRPRKPQWLYEDAIKPSSDHKYEEEESYYQKATKGFWDLHNYYRTVAPRPGGRRSQQPRSSGKSSSTPSPFEGGKGRGTKRDASREAASLRNKFPRSSRNKWQDAKNLKDAQNLVANARFREAVRFAKRLPVENPYVPKIDDGHADVDTNVLYDPFSLAITGSDKEPLTVSYWQTVKTRLHASLRHLLRRGTDSRIPQSVFEIKRSYWEEVKKRGVVVCGNNEAMLWISANWRELTDMPTNSCVPLSHEPQAWLNFWIPCASHEEARGCDILEEMLLLNAGRFEVIDFPANPRFRQATGKHNNKLRYRIKVSIATARAVLERGSYFRLIGGAGIVTYMNEDPGYFTFEYESTFHRLTIHFPDLMREANIADPTPHGPAIDPAKLREKPSRDEPESIAQARLKLGEKIGLEPIVLTSANRLPLLERLNRAYADINQKRQAHAKRLIRRWQQRFRDGRRVELPAAKWPLSDLCGFSFAAGKAALMEDYEIADREESSFTPDERAEIHEAITELEEKALEYTMYIQWDRYERAYHQATAEKGDKRPTTGDIERILRQTPQRTPRVTTVDAIAGTSEVETQTTSTSEQPAYSVVFTDSRGKRRRRGRSKGAAQVADPTEEEEETGEASEAELSEEEAMEEDEPPEPLDQGTGAPDIPECLQQEAIAPEMVDPSTEGASPAAEAADPHPAFQATPAPKTLTGTKVPKGAPK